MEEIYNPEDHIEIIQVGHFKEPCKGTSQAVQWLSLHLPMQMVQVQTLFGESRSHMLCGAAK